ncbi:hypothetical protein [Vibrio sp. L85]|uniref:hypothetical protein n=1 Tax=Vibrio sp. L85 TaxID=1769292 RepID=UPI001CBEA564|nr:hypothetical protein [Vibrio sp. L85]
MNLTLIKGQEVPLNVESSWLFIESYQGKLSVRLDATGEEFTSQCFAMASQWGASYSAVRASCHLNMAAVILPRQSKGKSSKLQPCRKLS